MLWGGSVIMWGSVPDDFALGIAPATFSRAARLLPTSPVPSPFPPLPASPGAAVVAHKLLVQTSEKPLYLGCCEVPRLGELEDRIGKFKKNADDRTGM